MSDDAIKPANFNPLHHSTTRRDALRYALVGGGLVAGAGALTGAGVLYSEHERHEQAKKDALDEIARASVLRALGKANIPLGAEWLQGLDHDGNQYLIRMHVGQFGDESLGRSSDPAYINSDLRSQYFPLVARVSSGYLPEDILSGVAATGIGQLLEAQGIRAQIVPVTDPAQASLLIRAADLVSAQEYGPSNSYRTVETDPENKREVVGTLSLNPLSGALAAYIVANVDSLGPRMQDSSIGDPVMTQQFAAAAQGLFQRELSRVQTRLSANARDFLSKLPDAPGGASITELMRPVESGPYKDTNGELNAPLSLSAIDKKVGELVKHPEQLLALPAGPSR